MKIWMKEKGISVEHILDIETEVFEKIKNHEILQLKVPATMNGVEIKKFDTLKLYHPGEKIEALRIEVVGLEPVTEEQNQDSSGSETVHKEMILVEFQLLEWMFRMETELDDFLREEKKWEGLL